MTETPKAEQRKLEARIKRFLGKGISSFGLIEKGDDILIGLSGGKDSLCLVDMLSGVMRNSNYSFKLRALHVKMSNVDYLSDLSYLKEFCTSRGVEFIVKEGSFEADNKQERSPCFLCSWNRRKILFAEAQVMGCNKIALGHHQDDIINTTLMNLSFAGSFSTMPAYLQMRKFPIAIIRPLCMEREADLKRWAEINSYQPLLKLCPHEKETKRNAIKEYFAKLEEISPEARFSIWHALEKDGKLVCTE